MILFPGSLSIHFGMGFWFLLPVSSTFLPQTPPAPSTNLFGNLSIHLGRVRRLTKKPLPASPCPLPARTTLPSARILDKLPTRFTHEGFSTPALAFLLLVPSVLYTPVPLLAMLPAPCARGSFSIHFGSGGYFTPRLTFLLMPLPLKVRIVLTFLLRGIP